MIKRIHVNQHVIRRNRKQGEREPPITVKAGRTNRYGNRVDVIVGCRVVASVVYRPDKPLACGATVWVETTEKLSVA